MKNPRQTVWFAHPIDEISNKLIAQLIEGGEDREMQMIDPDGKPIRVWQLRYYADYVSLSRNRSVQARFFRSQNGGKLECWPLPKRQESRPRRTGKEIADRLLADLRDRKARKATSCT